MLSTSYRRLILALALAFGLLASSVSAYAAPDKPAKPEGAESVPGEVLVQYEPGAGPDQRRVAKAKVNARSAERVRPAKAGKGEIERVRLGQGRSVEAAVRALEAHPAVALAEPNWIYTRGVDSDDPRYTDGSLWGMYGDATTPSNEYGSQAGEAWAAGRTGSSSVLVGVIDEGIDVGHPDLAGNIWTNPFDPVDGVDNDGNGYADDVHGWDFVGEDNSVYDGLPGDTDTDAHGTHVAGTIGGVGGNATGVVGVNWNVGMLSAKFLGPSGGTTADAIQAVDYITDLKTRHNLNIPATNNSWGGGGYSQLLADAIERANAAGILFVASAGNNSSDNDNSPRYPSSYENSNIIAVAAIDRLGARASFSNYGATGVDLGAPGVDIRSTTPQNTYASFNGTSMAAPHVTGAAALYASVHPAHTAAQIRGGILGNTIPTASLSGRTLTGGRLDVLKALDGGVAPEPPPCRDASLEPDNSAAQAMPFPLGGAQERAFCTAGDEDWVSFGAVAGAPYRMETLNLATSTDTMLVLYRATASGLVEVAHNDDSVGRASRIEHTATAYGTYYLRATQFSGSGCRSRTYDLRITGPANQPPSVGAGGPYTVGEGGSVSLTATGSDPEDGALAYEWDLDGDSAFEIPGQRVAFSAAELDGPLARTVKVRVTDPGGFSAEATATVDVRNAAPTGTFDAASPIEEGGSSRVGFTQASDPSSADTSAGFHYSIACDGQDSSLASTYADASATGDSRSCSFPESGSHTIKGRIFDEDGGYDTYSAAVEVENVAPSVDAGTDHTIDEGATFDSSGSFADPGGDTWTATVNYGDGSGDQRLTVGADKTFSLSHEYADDGAYVVTVTVDDGRASGSDTAVVTVKNVDPVATLSNNGPKDEGDPVAISFTNPSDPSSADTSAGFRYAYSCGNGDLGGATYASSGASASTTCTFKDNGTYAVKGRILDKDGGYSERTTTVTVDNAAPAVSAGPSSQNVQYSDRVGGVTITAADVAPDTAGLAVSTSYGIGGGATTQAGLPNGLSLAAGSTSGTWTLSGKAIAAPGTYKITVSVKDKDGATGSTDVAITVTREDARAYYAGGTYASTGSSTATTAMVTLSATIKDIAAVAGDPQRDGDAGDIRNARVTFVNRDASNAVLCSNLVVGLVDTTDAAVGTATCNYKFDIGAADSKPFTIGIVVSGYYARDASVDNQVVTVSKALPGMLTGGGYMVNRASGGKASGETGQRTNFGYNAKTTKTGAFQGNVNIIIRNGGRVYQIKSNAITSIGSKVSSNCSLSPYCRGTFSGKANIQDITNPLAPISIDGGALLQIAMTDRGEPGSSDSTAITLWDKTGGLWFSSNWNGTTTTEQPLSGGNIQVR